MKRVIETDEVCGLDALLGETVLLMCENYFYTGTLSGVNVDHVVLTSAAIVYETGAWNEAGWSDAQSLPNNWQISTSKIESYGLVNNV